MFWSELGLITSENPFGGLRAFQNGWNSQLKCSHGDLNDTYSKTLWQFVALK